MIWFSRQSSYSYAFTVSVPGKGVTAASQPSSASGCGQVSGVMFVCALLVAKGPSTTSNVGDLGQDIITMTEEAACLPCYILKTTSGAIGQGQAPAVAAL